MRTRTRECRVTKNSIQNGVIGSREMWRRSFLTFPCPCYPCLILLGAEGAGGGGAGGGAGGAPERAEKIVL